MKEIKILEPDNRAYDEFLDFEYVFKHGTVTYEIDEIGAHSGWKKEIVMYTEVGNERYSPDHKIRFLVVEARLNGKLEYSVKQAPANPRNLMLEMNKILDRRIREYK